MLVHSATETTFFRHQTPTISLAGIRFLPGVAWNVTVTVPSRFTRFTFAIRKPMW